MILSPTSLTFIKTSRVGSQFILGDKFKVDFKMVLNFGVPKMFTLTSL
jgi:hypothetical protein